MNSFKKIKNKTEFKLIKSYDIEYLFNSIYPILVYKIAIEYHARYDLTEFITLNKYKQLLKIVLYENYLYNGVTYYKQIFGIPMGGGCSSAIADLFLHYYEHKSTILLNVSFYRYVDDIFVGFNQQIVDLNIYPQDITLQETLPDSNGYINFLDVSLSLTSDGPYYRLYDKRDSYSFEVNRIIDWNNNLSVKIKRNFILNYITRCHRLNKSLTIRDQLITNFVKMLLKSEYPVLFVKRVLMTYFRISKEEVLSSYGL